MIKVKEMPYLTPGMLVHMPDGLWLQLLDTNRSIWSVNKVAVDGHRLVIENVYDISAEDVFKFDTVYFYEAGLGYTGALTVSMIKDLIRTDGEEVSKHSNDVVSYWKNPEYAPVKKMTVADIEEALGYKVEIVSDVEKGVK